MPNVKRLGKGASKAISDAIDQMFDRAKVRFLGPQSVLGKRIYIGYEREKSLPGIFEAGSVEERVSPDLEVLDALLGIAGDYIDATRNRTRARVLNEINAAILNARHQGGMDRQEFRDMVNTKLTEVWGEVTNNIHTIVDTEVSRAKNTSVLDGIIGANAAAGIEDPIVYFVVVRDNVLCDECKRLHLMPNKVTPRLWKLSEVGHGYHQKGDESPKLGGLHPHCRCTLVTLMPGYYFDRSGKVAYKKPGFDGLAHQRRLERSEQDEGEDLAKGWKGMFAAGALAALAPSSIGHETPPAPVVLQRPAPSMHPDLKFISQLETSGGKNLRHDASPKGKFHTAFGEYGLKPIVAHEHYLRDRQMQAKYPGLRDPKAFLKRFTSHAPFYQAMANNVYTSLQKLHSHVKNPVERNLRTVFGWRWGRSASANAPYGIVHADPYVRKFAVMQASHGAVAMNKSEEFDRDHPRDPKTGEFIAVEPTEHLTPEQREAEAKELRSDLPKYEESEFVKARIATCIKMMEKGVVPRTEGGVAAFMRRSNIWPDDPKEQHALFDRILGFVRKSESLAKGLPKLDPKDDFGPLDEINLGDLASRLQLQFEIERADDPELPKHPLGDERGLFPLIRFQKHQNTHGLATALKYLIHRLEHIEDYEHADKAKEADKAFKQQLLQFHILRGSAPDVVRGEPSIPVLRKHLSERMGLVDQLISHRDKLHKKLREGGHVRNVNGVDYVVLARGLGPGKRVPDPVLSSYADTTVTDVGSRVTNWHYHLVPLKNVWYSYNFGPRQAFDKGRRWSEDEYLVSPHELKPAQPTELKRMIERKLTTSQQKKKDKADFMSQSLAQSRARAEQNA